MSVDESAGKDFGCIIATYHNNSWTATRVESIQQDRANALETLAIRNVGNSLRYTTRCPVSFRLRTFRSPIIDSRTTTISPSAMRSPTPTFDRADLVGDQGTGNGQGRNTADRCAAAAGFFVRERPPILRSGLAPTSSQAREDRRCGRSFLGPSCLSQSRQSERFKRHRDEQAHQDIQAIHDEYVIWIEETMTTEPHPWIKVICAMAPLAQ